MDNSMSDVLNVSEMFGKNVFNDAVMREPSAKECVQEAEENH